MLGWRISAPARNISLSLFMICTVLLGFFIFHDGMTEEADAVRPVNVVFNFEPAEGSEAKSDGNVVEMLTGPTIKGSGTANVTGYVSIYRSAKVERTKVFVTNLRIRTTNPDLVGSVFPNIVEFTPGLKYQRIALTVNLKISRTTRYSTGPNPLINVTIMGDWQVKYEDPTTRSSGTIDPYPLYVNVKPYHFLTMTYDPPMLQLMPGATGYVECIVMNQGNGYERVELVLPGLMTFAKSGWIIEMEQTVLNIDPSSEERVRIKITSPREFHFQWHRTMISFPMYALSHYSKYQVEDLDLEYEYQSQTYDIQVQLSGFDFVYVPYMWAILFWIIIALVLFNVGINPFVMRKRRLPRGKDPGFIALYHFMNSPERRARWKERQAEKKKVRAAQRELRTEQKLKEKEQREKLKEAQAKKAAALPTSRSSISKERPPAEKRPVLDLKRSNDDFDIEIPDPAPKEQVKAKPLLSFGSSRPKKKSSIEKDMLDVLEHLDD